MDPITVAIAVGGILSMLAPHVVRIIAASKAKPAEGQSVAEITGDSDGSA